MSFLTHFAIMLLLVWVILTFVGIGAYTLAYGFAKGINAAGGIVFYCKQQMTAAYPEDERKGNAALITAAPNLLEALKLGLYLYEKDKSVGTGAGTYASKIIDWAKFWDTAEQIIAKAESQSEAVD